MSKQPLPFVASMDEILSNPLSILRIELADKFQNKDITPSDITTLASKLTVIESSNHHPERAEALQQEIANISAALQCGRALHEPDLSYPSTQLLWGVTLAAIACTEDISAGWPKKNRSADITKTPLWKQITTNTYMHGELRNHALFIEDSIRNPATRIRWAAPSAGYPAIGYDYDQNENVVNIDLVWSLMGGVEHSRAAVMREIGRSKLTVKFTPEMQAIRKKMVVLDNKKQNGSLTPKEYKHMALLSQEWQMRHRLFNEAENNMAGRYAANQSYTRIQDYAWSANNVETILYGTGQRLLNQPAETEASSPAEKFDNLCRAIRLSFFCNNGLFRDTEEDWKKMGVDRPAIESLSKDDGQPGPPFNELRNHCQKLETLQPRPRDRLYGMNRYHVKIEEDANQRNIITDEISRCVLPLMRDMLAEKEKPQGKQREEPSSQHDEDKESGDHSEPSQDKPGKPQANGKPSPSHDGEEQAESGQQEDGEPSQGKPGKPQANGKPSPSHDGEEQTESGQQEDGDPSQGKSGKPQANGKPSPSQNGDNEEQAESGQQEDGEPSQGKPGKPQANGKPSPSQNGDSEEHAESGQQEDGDPSQGKPQANGKPSPSQNEDNEAQAESGQQDDGEPSQGKPGKPQANGKPSPSHDGEEQAESGQQEDGEPSQGKPGKPQANGKPSPSHDSEAQAKSEQQGTPQAKPKQDKLPDNEPKIHVDGLGDVPDIKLPPAAPRPAKEAKPSKQEDSALENDHDQGKTIDELLKENPQQEAQKIDNPLKTTQTQGSNSHGGSYSFSAPTAPSTAKWNDYLAIVTPHTASISYVSTILKKIQDKQVQYRPQPVRELELLPDDGDLGRFQHSEHFDLMQKRRRGQEITLKDRHRFSVDTPDKKIPAPIDIVIMIDGSGSMRGAKMDNAMKAAIILYEAAKQAKLNPYVLMWGNNPAMLLAKPGDNDIEIGRKIAASQNGYDWGTDLAPALVMMTKTIAERKSDPESLVGCSHFFIISDGDINDLEESRQKVKALIEFSTHVTLDVAIINRNTSTNMDMLLTEIGKQGRHQCGVKHFNNAEDIQGGLVELLRLRTLMNDLKAIPYQQKAQQLTTTTQRMERR